jgi:hypothetical protein
MAAMLGEFIRDFTPEERVKRAARTAEPIADVIRKVAPRQRGRSAKEPGQNGG